MKNKLILCLSLVLGMMLLFTPGCAKKMIQTGFLDSYAGMEKDPEGFANLIYIDEEADWSSYNKIMLDEVEIFYSEGTDYKGIKPTEMSHLADSFHMAFFEALSSNYTFVDEPGPGVIRFRLAITGLVPTKRVMSTVTTVVPAGIAVSIVKRGVTGAHLGMGQVSIEGEIRDTQSHKRLAAIVDSKMGKKYRIDKSVTRWGHIENAFKDWAKTLSKRLDKRSGRE